MNIKWFFVDKYTDALAPLSKEVNYDLSLIEYPAVLFTFADKDGKGSVVIVARQDVQKIVDMYSNAIAKDIE